MERIRERGIPAKISYTAGTYVCNDVMYRLLYMIDKKYPEIRGGFIHVPFLPEQVTDLPDGTPSMSAETIARAIEGAVEAVVENREDVRTIMGETH